MKKLILHIILFIILAVMMFLPDAKSQELTHYQMNIPIVEEIEEIDSREMHEEVLEYVYKYDMPVEEIATEGKFDELPDKVKRAFTKSEYTSWTLMKVFGIEQDSNDLYMLVVEQNGFIETLLYDSRGKPINNF